MPSIRIRGDTGNDTFHDDLRAVKLGYVRRRDLILGKSPDT
jgi:hypothetical protein